MAKKNKVNHVLLYQNKIIHGFIRFFFETIFLLEPCFFR